MTIDWQTYPVLGICGWSNSGKTTLIEQLLAWFREESLKTIVIKRDEHGIELDVTGKDTDRFFHAGADVLIQGQDQTFIRSHHHNQDELLAAIPDLAQRYDFIIIEGHKRTPIPKVWLTAPGHQPPPHDLTNCLAEMTFNDNRLVQVQKIIEQRLNHSA